MQIELDIDRATAVHEAIKDWCVGAAQCLSDQAAANMNMDIGEWLIHDDFAGRCEELAWAARVMATISHRLEMEHRQGQDLLLVEEGKG